jgi:redox-sensitive bicupin YhaK (pirin superfamily)
MKTTLHRADSRGHANHGWLNSHHSFSFAGYRDPLRMHFGVLRVLNDDVVAPGQGFGTHPHDNMEIVSIPLEGDLEHKDSMGNTTVIKQGDLQVMSAGTGIQQSEYNKNSDREVKFLQIWIIPKVKGVEPRYDQITLDGGILQNKLAQVLSPSPDDEGVWIHQDAWFHLGKFDHAMEIEYTLKNPSNGVYAFLLEGSAEVNGNRLERRDGLGIEGPDKLQIKAGKGLYILLMEVPMTI